MLSLTPDGRETLEDALRILIETAGDDAGRVERERKAAALWAELSGHPIMAAVQRGERGVGALLTPERVAELARDCTGIEVEAGSALTPELEADLWRRGEVRQRATRVREICQRAQELIGSPRQALARRSPDRALELLDELADAAGALVEAQAAGERAPRPPMDPPPGAIAYKYADPTEGARWLYDETELRRVRSEDPNLIVAVETHGTSRRDFEAELAMALLETVDELETAYSILEQLEDAPLPAEDAGAIGRVLNAERESKAQSDRRRLLQERLNDPREGYVEGGESDAR